MTKIAVIGTGPAGVLHVEAARACGLDVVAVANQLGNATIAQGLKVPLTSVEAAIDLADLLVIATPPATHADLVEQADTRVKAMLVESPIAATVRGAYSIAMATTPTMTAANLVHSPAGVALRREVSRLEAPHHLAGSARTPKPSWGAHGTATFGGGAIVSVAGLMLPAMLAVAAEPVVAVTARLHGPDGVDHAAHIDIELDSGRRVSLTATWGEDHPRWDIEAADQNHAVRGQLMPAPAIEIDGVNLAVDVGENNLVNSGAIAQLRRLDQATRSGAAVWPDGWAGYGAVVVMVAAAQSAALGGRRLPVVEVELDMTPAELWPGPAT